MTASSFGPVAVVGAGVMGADILALLAAFGLDAALVCRDTKEAGVRARELHKRISRWEAAGARVNVTHLSAAADTIGRAGLVIEAVTEDAAVKRRVLEAIAPLLAQDAVVATNSSSIGPSRLAVPGIKPGSFLGMHFFHPARMKGVVELIRSDGTSGETVRRVEGFSRALGMRVLAMPEGHGFVLNRIFLDVHARAWDISRGGDGGPTIEQIDEAAAAIIPAGIFSFMDAVGLDTVRTAVRNYAEMGLQTVPCGPLADELERLAGSGRLGVKTRGGFREYPGGKTPGPGTGHIPPETMKSIRDGLSAVYVNAFCAAVETGHFGAEELDGALRDYASCDRGPLSILGDDGPAHIIERLERFRIDSACAYRVSEYLRGLIR